MHNFNFKTVNFVKLFFRQCLNANVNEYNYYYV